MFNIKTTQEFEFKYLFQVQKIIFFTRPNNYSCCIAFGGPAYNDIGTYYYGRYESIWFPRKLQ